MQNSHLRFTFSPYLNVTPVKRIKTWLLWNSSSVVLNWCRFCLKLHAKLTDWILIHSKIVNRDQIWLEISCKCRFSVCFFLLTDGNVTVSSGSCVFQQQESAGTNRTCWLKWFYPFYRHMKQTSLCWDHKIITRENNACPPQIFCMRWKLPARPI